MSRAISLRAFTLIELLIVVAIIAILAAIAVPNFLEAQIRAKVTRAKADMRNLATGLEAYRIDWNRYPIPYPHIPEVATNLTGTNVPNELSTPTAYITSATSFFDPFSIRMRGMFDGRYNRYGYINTEIENHRYVTGSSALTPENLELCGYWRLDGYGPTERIIGYPNEVTYDPSNGTVSRGQIYRSQRMPEHVQQ
ncbi:prepilin-type N-terminal cleavage/methylation domain-containing protein [Candidatus Sumerlaeota bacterium]|nr:prepilin-type N-terminal cleavage/methylation domain-containing protein [Candidatus Sumerlaeota bacterium]